MFCNAQFHHFSGDGHVESNRSRPDEVNLGKTAAEKVERRPEEFVISAEDLSNPFAVFGKPKTSTMTATTAAAAPKILEEDERKNK